MGIPLASSAASTREKRDMIVIRKMGPKMGTVITNRSIATRPRSVRLQRTAPAAAHARKKRKGSHCFSKKSLSPISTRVGRGSWASNLRNSEAKRGSTNLIRTRNASPSSVTIRVG